jgi:hypothetical protein
LLLGSRRVENRAVLSDDPVEHLQARENPLEVCQLAAGYQDQLAASLLQPRKCCPRGLRNHSVFSNRLVVIGCQSMNVHSEFSWSDWAQQAYQSPWPAFVPSSEGWPEPPAMFFMANRVARTRPHREPSRPPWIKASGVSGLNWETSADAFAKPNLADDLACH